MLMWDTSASHANAHEYNNVLRGKKCAHLRGQTCKTNKETNVALLMVLMCLRMTQTSRQWYVLQTMITFPEVLLAIPCNSNVWVPLFIWLALSVFVCVYICVCVCVCVYMCMYLFMYVIRKRTHNDQLCWYWFTLVCKVQQGLTASVTQSSAIQK